MIRIIFILILLCGCASRLPDKPKSNRLCDQIIEDPEGVMEKQPPQVLELQLEMGVTKIVPKEKK